MEFQKLIRYFVKGFLVSASYLASVSAFAATVSVGSILGLTGQYSSTGFPNVQSFSFVDGSVVAAAGDFNPSEGEPTSVTLSSAVSGINSVDVTSFFQVDNVFSLNTASTTLYFHLDSIYPVSTVSPDEFRFTGSGTVTGVGIDETAISWDFSAESASNYNLNITAVPVPAAAWLFGSALLGLVSLRRK